MTVEELLETLVDPRFNVRFEAIISIARMGPDPRLVEAVAGVLEGREISLSVIAAWALGRMGSDDALPALRRGLNSTYRSLQAHCARSLGTLGDQESAPLLLERLATLTERLTMVLSDKNQKSIENILAHTDKMTANLADASPQVQRTLSELQSTLRQATYTLSAFEKVAGSADNLLNDQGNGLAKQLRDTLKSAQGAADALNATATAAQPGLRQFDEKTLPAAEAAMRDLQATTRSLRELTDRINDRGVSSVVGSPKLPDYKH